MSNPTPIIPPVVPYPATYRPFTNAVPFTARSGATFQEELYGIKNWLNETLVPYLDEQFPAFTDSWKAMAEEIIDSFNETTTDLAQVVNDAVAEIIAGTTVTDAMMKNVALIPGGLFATQLNSTYVPRPTGSGTDGQVPTKSGTGFIWGNGGQTDPDLYQPAPIPSWVTKPGRFDPRSSVYNLTARSLSRWYAALARAAAGGICAHEVNLGDSITQGAGSAAPYTTTAWTSLMRAVVYRQWGDPGGYGVDTFNDSGSTAADPFVVITGFTRDGSRGLHGEARTSAASGNTIVYGPAGNQIRCTKYKITYAKKSGGGHFTYQVDALTAVDIDTADTAESIATVTVSASAAALPHTLTIAALAAGITILSVEAWITDVGRVKVTRAGRNGAKINGVTTTTNPTSALYALQAMAPDLVVLMMETNDYDGQTAVATYKAGIEATIVAARAVNSDVLLVATIPPNIDPATVPAHPIPLSTYTRALYELADQYDLPLLDMQHRWTSWTVSNAAPYLLYADNLHPSPRGHYDIGRGVYAVAYDTWRQAIPVLLDVAQSWTAVQTFGYPGQANEQIQIGGVDLMVTPSSPTIPTIGATTGGGVYASPKAGQTWDQFGKFRSQGGIELAGVNPLKLAATATGSLPSATTSGVGAMIFDTTRGKVVVSNGTNWVNPDGSTT